MTFKTFIMIFTLILSSFCNSNLIAQIQSNEIYSTRLEKGKYLIESNNYEQAQEFFSNLLKDHPKSAEAHYYLGMAYALSDDPGNATKCFKNAVSLKDSSANYHLMYGNSLFNLAGRGSKFKAFGRAKKGKKELERVLELDSNNISARYSLMQFYLRAPGILGGDKTRAKQLMNEMNTIASKNLISISAKIEILIASNKLEKAFNELKKCIPLCKTTRDSAQTGRTYNILGYKYLKQKSKNCDKAISCFKSYILLAPNKANAHDSLGEAYYKCGDFDSSIAEYEKALSINPDFKNSKKMLKKVKKEMKK